MKALFRRHPFALTGFVLASAVTFFFMVRIAMSVLYWMDPAHHNETVKPWMTVGYIAKSWDLDPREIDAMAGLPTPEGHGPWTLREVATSRGGEVQAVIDQVNETIAILQARKPAE